eukprot:366462-Chlamydomonas_euryale.AAC.37
MRSCGPVTKQLAPTVQTPRYKWSGPPGSERNNGAMCIAMCIAMIGYNAWSPDRRACHSCSDEPDCATCDERFQQATAAAAARLWWGRMTGAEMRALMGA